MNAPRYTAEDLSVAGTILACKNQTCSRTGEPMFPESFIAWAKLVMKTFAQEAWRLVKSVGISLSQAWSQVMSMGAKDRRGRIVFAPEGMTGRRLVRKPETALFIQTL